MGAYVPFWPLWLEDWGLEKAEIGYFLTTAIAVRIVAGLGLPMLADRLDSRRNMVAGLCLLGAALFLLHLWISTKLVLLLATIATGAVIAGVMPLGEALGLAASRRHKFPYAPARAIGSVAFLLAAYLVGELVVDFGINVVVYIIVVTYLATAFLGKSHPGGGGAKKKRPGIREISKIIGNPLFAWFALGIGCLQASHAVYFAYSSIHWRALGFDEDYIGLLWSFAIIAEVLMMLGPGPMLVRKLGMINAIALAGGVAVLRWIAMSFDPVGAWLWVLQGTHGFTFGLGHLGAMAFILSAVPERANASAQGAYSGFSVGILMALGTVVAARLYPQLAAQTYFVGSVIATIGVVACVVLVRRWDGKPLEI